MRGLYLWSLIGLGVTGLSARGGGASGGRGRYDTGGSRAELNDGDDGGLSGRMKDAGRY